MIQEEFIEQCLVGEWLRSPGHPSYRGQHVLIVDSLKDGKASCSCGRWTWTGGEVCSLDDICKIFSSHFLHYKDCKSVPKKGTLNAKCSPKGELADVDLTVNGFVLG